jgi:hypothetical protein
MINGAETCIFDFFSQAQISAVIANQFPDVTAEIATALATGKNLYFPAGGYGHTGGLIQNNTGGKGQNVRGEGQGKIPQATNTNGTVLKKLSGSSTGYRFDSDYGSIQDIQFDNNGLNGLCFHVSCHYGFVKNIIVGNMNASTTDATVRFESVNLSKIDTINFFNYNYLPVEFYDTGATLYGALYTDFHNINFGAQGGNCVYGIKLSSVITCKFYNCFIEEPLRFENNNTNNDFYSLKSEGLPVTKSLISCSTSYENNQTNNFYGLRFANFDADRTTVPVISLKYIRNTNFYGCGFEDNFSTAPFVFELTAARQFSVRDCTIRYVNNYTFINALLSTNYNEDIVVDNCVSYATLGTAGSIGTCAWAGYAKALSVSNTDMKQTLGTNAAISVPNYTVVNFTNVTPGLNGILVNAGYAHVSMNFVNCKNITDNDGWAYLTNCVLQNGVYVGSGKAKSTVLTLTASGTATWSNVIPLSCIIKNVTLYNINDTGQNYNVGNSNVGAAVWGNNVSKSAGTAQYSQSYDVLYPLYNPNSAADNLVLTATAGNFTNGAQVRACLVYEPLGFLTS